MSSNNRTARCWTKFRGCCGCGPGYYLVWRVDSAWKNLAGSTACGNQCDWSNIFNRSLQYLSRVWRWQQMPSKLVLKRVLSLMGDTVFLLFVWLCFFFFFFRVFYLLSHYSNISGKNQNFHISKFLNFLQLRSSTTTEVHRTSIGLSNCFSSCYILSLWLM